MGSFASCSRRTDAVSTEAIRIVHLNGQLDEFPVPISVKLVLQNYPCHFICSSRDPFAVNCRPLQLDEDLQVGDLYFLLPLAVLDSDMSIENLVALAARLRAAAGKEARLRAAARKEVSKAAQRQRRGDSTCNLPSEGYSSIADKFLQSCDDPVLKMALREHLISKSRSWRPRLDTIQETGFAC